MTLLATDMADHVHRVWLFGLDGSIRYSADLVKVDFLAAPPLSQLLCLLRLLLLL